MTHHSTAHPVLRVVGVTTGEASAGRFPFEVSPKEGLALERQFAHRRPFWTLYGPENLLAPGRHVLRLCMGDARPCTLANPYLTAASAREAEMEVLGGNYDFVAPTAGDPPGLLGSFRPRG